MKENENIEPTVLLHPQAEMSVEPKMPVIDEVKVKAAKDELDAFQASLHTKKYGVKADSKLVLDYIKFIEDGTKWTAMESLGVVELHKRFKEIQEEGPKSGLIYLKNIEVDALHYFLSKVSGIGMKQAETYMSLIKPLNDAIKDVQADSTNYNNMNSRYLALSQGIDLEPEVKKEKKEVQEFGD